MREQHITIRINERERKIEGGTLVVFDHKMHLDIPLEMEAYIRKGEKEIIDTLNCYAQEYGDTNPQIPAGGFVAMAALDIASRHHQLLEKNDYKELLSRIERLNEKAEGLIAESSL